MQNTNIEPSVAHMWCHKEVSKNYIIFFEKQNVEDLKYQLENKIYNDNELNKLTTDAKIYVNRFNWKKCAKETLEVCNKIIN